MVNVGKTRPILKLTAAFVSTFSRDNGNKLHPARTFSTIARDNAFLTQPGLRSVKILDRVDVP